MFVGRLRRKFEGDGEATNSDDVTGGEVVGVDRFSDVGQVVSLVRIGDLADRRRHRNHLADGLVTGPIGCRHGPHSQCKCVDESNRDATEYRVCIAAPSRGVGGESRHTRNGEGRRRSGGDVAAGLRGEGDSGRVQVEKESAVGELVIGTGE